MTPNETVLSGALILAVPVALFGGLVSFFSPCVLPLVPGYLSYVTGFSAVDLQDAEGRRRGRMLAGALLFVLGFSAVFISEGSLFGFVGQQVMAHQTAVNRVAGVLTILMGLAFAGVLPGFTQREVRSHRRPMVGLVGAPLLGIVFGLGWTPCIGPVLSSVIFLAGQQGSAARGSLLALAYCLGLGIPFLAAALAFRKVLGAFGWVKGHYRLVTGIGGGVLVVVGVLLLTGVWAQIDYQLTVWTSNFTTGI